MLQSKILPAPWQRAHRNFLKSVKGCLFCPKRPKSGSANLVSAKSLGLSRCKTDIRQSSCLACRAILVGGLTPGGTMRTRASLSAVVAAFTIIAVPAFAGAGAGGNGGGHGNSGSNGGGNSAWARSQSHGAATSAAAKDASTSGLAKALSVVGTTPASPQATLSIQAALDALLAKATPTDTTGDTSPTLLRPQTK